MEFSRRATCKIPDTVNDVAVDQHIPTVAQYPLGTSMMNPVPPDDPVMEIIKPKPDNPVRDLKAFDMDPANRARIAGT